MGIKDELKKVFNPELVDTAADKLKEINESETTRKIKAAAKNVGNKLSDKLDELAKEPPKMPEVHLPEGVKKSAGRGIRTIITIAVIVFAIWIGVAIAGFIGGIFSMILF